MELKSDSIPHDLTLVDLRQALLQTDKVEKFHTENQIETWDMKDYWNLPDYLRYTNCDGAVSIRLKGGSIYEFAFEYEHSRKSDIKYQHFVAKYNSTYGGSIVFVVAKTQGIMKQIYKHDEAINSNAKPKFFVALEKAILKDGNFTFSNYEGDCFNLNISKKKKTPENDGD